MHKVGSGSKGRGLAALGHLQTCPQSAANSHSSSLCCEVPWPLQGEGPCRDSTKMHKGSPPLPLSPEQQRVSGIKEILSKVPPRKTLYIILSGITLFFYFQCFYSKIHVIVYCMDTKSGYADNVLLYDLFCPQAIHATLIPFPDRGSTLQNDHRKRGSFILKRLGLQAPKGSDGDCL